MTRDQFIKENPINVVLESKGVKLIGRGDQRTALCPFHRDHNPSFSVNVAKGVWRCITGCGQGSVIDLLAMFDGISPVEYMRKNSIGEFRTPLFGGGRRSIFQKREKPAPKKTPPPENVERKIVDAYIYHDAQGREVYQVLRYEPKHFKQQRKDGDKWVWGMENVTRVLYHLPQVLKAKECWYVEGEKDTNNLCALGFCATTSVGGAQSWLDAYALSLEGKDVVICGDNDKAGKEYVDQVFQSIADKAASVRIVEIPKEHKDVSDFIETFKGDSKKAREALEELRYHAFQFIKGHRVMLKTLAQMEQSYIRSVREKSSVSFNLANWLPCLSSIRPLVPGEMVLIIGATSVGKTALALNIVLRAAPLPTVLFELELPDDPLFERLVAAKHNMTCEEVEAAYERKEYLGDEFLELAYPKFVICSESGLTVDKIEDQILRSELVIGERPVLAIIDYIQLMQGHGSKRYERFSDIAEGLKQVAKRRKVILIILSQTQRPEDKHNPSPEITLFSAKESGSIEASSGLVIGIWRDPKVETLMHARILKNTRGKPGLRFKMNFDGAKMLYTDHNPALSDEVHGNSRNRSNDN